MVVVVVDEQREHAGCRVGEAMPYGVSEKYGNKVWKLSEVLRKKCTCMNVYSVCVKQC